MLAILSEGPQHGYGISRAIRERSAEVLKLGEGQLYPVLHGLQEAGWIHGEWEMQEGDPPKRVYRITPAGRAELVTRAQKWRAFADAVGQVLPSAPKLEAGHE
ncbi:Transcriptional regulator, PadR family [Fimbriimonas ginsengisoli Gsoil 348]|uniref:Transcriptional regulator, PadR family n=1 Tax=Fimbriimonas ginsengisoli Gsoil 348 TaxID=661478 RepID=A0A068NSW0_FIMGI|nr:Transcriptional regulator, PadR family [Fimbriimonas ginsengisoli Gsoil 348]